MLFTGGDAGRAHRTRYRGGPQPCAKG